MIDPNEVTTARVGELPPSPFDLTDNIPHEIGDTLFRGTVQQLGDVIGDYLGAVSGLSFNNTVVPDGGTLPDTETKEWLFVGKGTFHNVGGQPDIITTEVLNILSSNGIYWSLAVEIPIDVELAGITQNIRSGYTETTPSEDAVYKRIAEIIGMIPQDTDDISNVSNVDGSSITEALNNLENSIPTSEVFVFKNTIAEIRVLSGTLPSNNFYTTDLGQEGNWYYDASDTTSADNTGTILVTADGKRIKRTYKYNELNIAWFITNKLAQYYSSGISITTGTNVLNVTGANFDSSYIGAKVRLYSGGVAGAYLLATISSVNSATQVVISVNASSTLTNVQGIIGGFDETASFQSAIDILNQHGGKLIIPEGRYYIDGTIYIKPVTLAIPISIQGQNEMPLQDAWAQRALGSCILKNNSGDVFRVNMDNTGLGVIVSPSQYLGFSAYNLVFVGDDKTAGVNAFNIFRTRSNIQNISAHRIDYAVKQLTTDIIGTNATFNDMSLYKNIRIAWSKLGGLLLEYADASTISEFYYESGDTNSKYGLEINHSKATFANSLLHGVANNEANTAGSALIKTNQLFGGTFTGIHSENCNFESVVSIVNSGAISINGVSTILAKNTFLKIDLVKGLSLNGWYDYTTTSGGSYDIDYGTNVGNRDITIANTSFFDVSQPAGTLRRDMLIGNPTFRGLTYLATPIEYVSDMNSIDGNKQFRSKTGCTNLPSGITNFSGTQYLLADNNNFRVQSGMGGDFIYTRYMSSGVWGSWMKVLNTTDLTTINADIANRIAFDSVTDFNAPTQYKILRGGVSATNAPYSAATYFQGIQFAAANNATFSNQLIFDALGDIFTRTRSSGVWGSYNPVAQFVSQDVTGNISVSARNRSTIYNCLTTVALNINLLNDVNSIGNVFKIFLNRGNNNLSVQCSPSVTIDGATTTINLPNNGDELWLYAISPNTYITLNKKVNNITSASYTPTVTAGTNVTSATLSTASYTKIGNIVTGSIAINMQATAINSLSEITFTAPVNRAGVVPNYYVGNGTYAADIAYSAGNAFFSSFGTSTITLRFNSGASVASPGNLVFTFQYDVTK